VDLADITSKRSKPAITMAKTILAEGEYGTEKKDNFLGNKMSFSELGRRWRLFGHVSIFHLLIFRERFPKPVSLKSGNFGERLLQLADDYQVWQQFAADYQAAWKELRGRHYAGLPSLALPTNIALPKQDLLPLPSLPKNVREAVQRYGTEGRRSVLKNKHLNQSHY
jgi:hypothetical protein